MMRLLARAMVVLPMAWLAGCGVPESVAVDVASDALVTNNGQMQNGQMQNGQMQNGQMQNGAAMQLIGVELEYTYRLINRPATGQDPDVSPANRVLIPNVHLDKSTLTDGTQSGAAFQGDVVWGEVMDEFGAVQWGFIYLESVTPTADPEITHYVLKANHRFVPAAGKTCLGACQMVWDYVCGSFTERYIDPNGGILLRTFGRPATAVGGQWDYHHGVEGGGRKLIEQGNASYAKHVTFACSNGAIGKCVETMHYKPWALAARECARSSTFPFLLHCYQPTQELLHEACVRMVRADYCGDGQDHTVNGISIDVWDQSGIEHETPYAPAPSPSGIPYGHEAEWTPNGARCLSQILMTRTSHLGSADSVGWYLMNPDRPWCSNKWGTNTNWPSGHCFMGDSTYFINNVTSDLDWHNRVLIRNKSVCIDDGGGQPNSMKTSQPWCAVCLPDLGEQPSCPPPSASP